MKRFISSLAMLAVIALIGCEKHESPVAPPQEQQVKSTSGFDAKASAAQLKEKVEAWKAKVEERAAALKIQTAKQRQLQSSIPQVAGGSKITVPSSSFPTIQSAVTAASPGTKIIVKDGTYTEVVTVTTNNLTITAAHAGQAHVIGGFGFGGVTGGKLEGFVITEGTDPFESGVVLESCTKVEIKENEVTGGYGILLYVSESCVVKDNEVSGTTGGLLVPAGVGIYYGGKHLVKGNEAHDNLIGILVYGGLTGEESPGKNEISSNECTGNIAGIALFASDENDLGDNECNDNIDDNIGGGFGIYLISSDRNKIGSDNEANGNASVGILLGESNDNLVKKNEAHGNDDCDVIDQGTGNTFIENDFGSFNCL